MGFSGVISRGGCPCAGQSCLLYRFNYTAVSSAARCIQIELYTPRRPLTLATVIVTPHSGWRYQTESPHNKGWASRTQQGSCRSVYRHLRQKAILQKWWNTKQKEQHCVSLKDGAFVEVSTIQKKNRQKIFAKMNQIILRIWAQQTKKKAFS